MAQAEGIVYARDDAFNDGAPSTWMRTGNAQVARMGGVARTGRARAPRATQNSRYELINYYKGRRKDASRAKLFKCPPRDTSLSPNVPE